MSTRSEDIADITVFDEREQPIRLGDLWADGPAVIAFVRHFG